MMVLGIVGAMLCVLAYMLIVIERVNPHGIAYCALNGVGGVFLLISIASDYDAGDTGGILVEVCWIVISIFGVIKATRKKTVMDEGAEA